MYFAVKNSIYLNNKIMLNKKKIQIINNSIFKDS